MAERDDERVERRAPPTVPQRAGSAPFRNMIAVPEGDPGFGREMTREVRDSARSRLAALDKVYRSLQEEARTIVGATRRDLALHEVPLNGTKLRGRVYHLYERPGGERFLSLLEPEHYGDIDPDIAHRGSYRLNHDASWERLDADDTEDKLAWAEVEPSGETEGTTP
ncbi:MAG: DUF2452 domain-containing protein [Myxococcota bacterium]